MVTKKVSKPAEPKDKLEPRYDMPVEVQEWIERANSMLMYLRGKVDRLESENRELKAYRKFAEGKILNVSHE
jgi:hypothetical protein